MSTSKSTSKKNPPKSEPNRYDYDKRPLSASKLMMDLMIKRKSPDVKAKDLLAVFFFYCYTGTWQRTWYPHCTISYVAKGLGMSVATVRKAKAELIRLNLAEEVKFTSMKNGRNVILYRMHVHYFESDKDLQNLQGSEFLYPTENCNTTKIVALHSQDPNSYHTDILNTYHTNRRIIARGKSPSTTVSIPNPVSYGRIQKLIPDTSTTPLKPKAHSKKIKISPTAKEEIQLQQAYKVATKLQFALSYNNWISWTPNLNKWIKGIIKLRKADLNPVKFKDMLIAIAFLKEHGNEIHCPKPKNADQFANKYPQILDAIKRNKGQLKDDSKNSSNNIHDDSSCNDGNKLPLGCKCQKCQRTDLPVYLIIQPGTFNESAKVCKKCFRKLDKIFRDRQENEK